MRDGDQHDADSGTRPLIYSCGHLLERELTAFDGRFQEILTAAKQRTGDKRNATPGECGDHQRTPSFIEAVTLKALETMHLVGDESITITEEDNTI